MERAQAQWIKFQLEGVSLPDEQLRRAAYLNGTSCGPGLRDGLARAARRALSLSRPAGCWTLVPLGSEAGRTEAEEELSAITCRHALFRGASHCAVALLTTGSLLDREVQRLFSAHMPLEAYFLDTAASLLLSVFSEEAIAQITEALRREGLDAGLPLQPGCHQISLEAQRLIFRLLPAEDLGISLHDSLLMQPVKSVSYMIPFGASLAVPRGNHTMCDICERRSGCQFSQAV